MVRPVLVAGVLMTAANFLFIDQVLPRGNLRLLNLRQDIGQKKPTFALREQAINPVPQSLYFIRASRIEPGTGRMREVVNYEMIPPTGRRVIYADSGIMTFAQNNQDLRIDLYNGEVHEYSTTEPTSFTLTRFTLNEVTVRNVQNAFRESAGGVTAGDREMTTCQMMDKVTRSRDQIIRIRERRARIAENGVRSLLRLTGLTDVDTASSRPEPPHCAALWRRFEHWVGRTLLPPSVEAQGRPAQGAADTGLSPMDRARLITAVPSPTLSEVNDVRDQEAMVRGEIRQYTVEIHKKFSLSVACTTFVLIGIALALRFPRGGMGLVIGASLVIFAVFYVGLTVGENLGDRGMMDPAFAMWLPNLIVLVVGVLGLLRVNREFGSTRGGDLADLTDWLFGWIRFRRRARA
jgi:lipopolysaccharide export system permease protein